MSLTVRDLLDLPGLGLGLVAGEAGLDSSIRWVHTSELEDPTPWLSGGEFLLTTGMALKGAPAAQRAYFRRLVEAGLAGLGFGIGFGFEEVPAPIRRAADREGFPILEVPYPVPFIAITEAVASRLNEERIRDAQMSVEVHGRLAALVTDGSGPADVLDEVVSLAGGWTILFDPRGNVIARAGAAADRPDPDEVWSGLPRGLVERTGPSATADLGPHGSQVGVAVMAGKRHEGVLVFGKDGKLDGRDRIVVHHAVTVLGLLLASRRAIIETERRVAGDIIAEAFSGELAGRELERRLDLVGFSPGAKVGVIAAEPASETDASAREEIELIVDGVLGLHYRTVRTVIAGTRIASVVAVGEGTEPGAELASQIVEAASGSGPAAAGLRIGVGEVVDARDIRHAYLSAVFALRASPSSRRICTPADLGSYGFLLGARPDGVLDGFVRSVLGPLLEHDENRNSELVASVRAFIDAGGRWEPGAVSLGIHRHTLRYRVRQAEELLGRDLSRAEDRLEIWLALKALDLGEE